MGDIREQTHDPRRHSRIRERYELVEKIAIQIMPSFISKASMSESAVDNTMDYAVYLANALEIYKSELEREMK